MLDEADRILDLGFAAALNAILENLPEERQTMLYSATQTRYVHLLIFCFHATEKSDLKKFKKNFKHSSIESHFDVTVNCPLKCSFIADQCRI